MSGLMAKGYDEHQARQLILSSLGKDLARRSKSTCELSGRSGVPLHIYEVPPAGDPCLDRCLFLCEEVLDQLKKPAKIEASQWHHLNELIWSEIPAVRLMSARLLMCLANDHSWAREALEQAYLDDETLAAAEAAPLG